MHLEWWSAAYIDGILPKGPYPPCLHMADRAFLAAYPRYMPIIGSDLWLGAKPLSEPMLAYHWTMGNISVKFESKYGICH